MANVDTYICSEETERYAILILKYDQTAAFMEWAWKTLIYIYEFWTIDYRYMDTGRNVNLANCSNVHPSSPVAPFGAY
jgi:hypothetical protein